MGYGYEVKGLDDPKVNASRKLAQVVIETALPGALLINDLPFCEYSIRIGRVRRSFTTVRYVPGWLPWLSYKPLARYGYNIAQEVLHRPIEFVRESIVSVFDVQRFLNFKSLRFASLTELLSHHLLSRICKRRRNSKNQNAKKRKKWLLGLWDRWI